MSPSSRRAAVPLAVWAAGASLLAGGALLTLRGRASSAPPPAHLGALPSFALVERSGRRVDGAVLRGRVWVVDFIFTSCGGLCPAMTARMARLRKEVAPEVGFLSITVDPVHDTPDVLGRYAEPWAAGDRWLFLTGPPAAVYDLSVRGFKLAAMEVPATERVAGSDGPFLHSGKFVLVDGAGAIRGYYDSDDEEAMKTLVRDARLVRDGA